MAWWRKDYHDYEKEYAEVRAETKKKKSNSFDPRRQYNDDEHYTITGAALNQIAQLIRDLETELEQLDNIKVQEELKMLRIRDRHPAVKEAWDQYQTVLKLAVKN